MTSIGEVLQWANLAFIPLLLYIIKIETRMAKIELLLKFKFKNEGILDMEGVFDG